MSRTVIATIVKTINLEDDYTDYTDQDLIEMFDEDFHTHSLDDWRWDDESVTFEVLPTEQVILGE